MGDHALYKVDIWEDRKVFGSRGQNLKNEILGKSPPVNNVKSSNPIKVMKRDSTSLRIVSIINTRHLLKSCLTIYVDIFLLSQYFLLESYTFLLIFLEIGCWRFARKDIDCFAVGTR